MAAMSSREREAGPEQSDTAFHGASATGPTGREVRR
jgi:hypothetical protein